jgi:nucleoside-diphosphate-sugar epimerase
LITGGGGFIGTQLASRLSRENDVVLLDMDFSRNAFAFTELGSNQGVETAIVDIMDTKRLDEVVHGAQIVIHAAAVLGVQKVIRNTIETLEVNYIGTSNVLKALSRGQACERFVLLSSSEVYGSSASEIAETGDAVLPSIDDPRWCYSISKAAAEHLTLGYHRERGLPVVVVRPFNVFGPGRVGKYAILQFILKALKNEDLEVYGDGTQVRAWCYIDDFCQGFIEAVRRETAIGQAFNIGNPTNRLTNCELVEKIVRLSNSVSRIVHKPLDFKDIAYRVPDISKARSLLGYDPTIEMDEGLIRTINWVRQNHDRLAFV